jgi:hypothetical protein
MMLWKRVRLAIVTAGITRMGHETSESLRKPRQEVREVAMRS